MRLVYAYGDGMHSYIFSNASVKKNIIILLCLVVSILMLTYCTVYMYMNSHMLLWRRGIVSLFFKILTEVDKILIESKLLCSYVPLHLILRVHSKCTVSIRYMYIYTLKNV